LQKSNTCPILVGTYGNPAKKHAKEMRSTNIQAVICFCPKFHQVVTEEKKGAANPTKDFF
jgi:hypothetical protein